MNQEFVIKNKRTKKFIAIDFQSGGYPYEVDKARQAKIWSHIDEALQYKDTFKEKIDWELHIININTQHINWPIKLKT